DKPRRARGACYSPLDTPGRQHPDRAVVWTKCNSGDPMPLRMRVHDREPICAALRRFKKLLERSGLQKELRKRKHYEKPCEVRRRSNVRKWAAIRKARGRNPGV